MLKEGLNLMWLKSFSQFKFQLRNSCAFLKAHIKFRYESVT